MRVHTTNECVAIWQWYQGSYWIDMMNVMTKTLFI